MLVSQGNNNPLPSLGESVSFGRFISDSSLAWDKWSTFSSHNRYVEEAERYAQPGSVAEKKAFFEAHYKRIAAQKAAAAAADAAAAAQLHHTNNVAPESSHVINKETQNSNITQLDNVTLSVPVTNHAPEEEDDHEREASPVRDIEPLDQIGEKIGIPGEMEQIQESPTVSFEEKPLLQHKCERNHVSSSSTSKSSAPLIRAAKLFSSPAKPAAIITLHSKVFQYSSIVTTPRPEPDNKIKPNTPPPATARKIESSKVVPASNKVFKTPTRNCWNTPSSKASSTKTAGTKHHPSKTSTTTPLRSRTPSAPSASGSKTSGPKWHLLSSVCSKSLSACKNKLQSPTLAMPFSLRTEERATRRKQNLEEKFNSKDAEKLQLQARIKEKAETEFRRFRESFCFRARPLPDFYKDREIIKKEISESNKMMMGTRPGCMNVKKKKHEEEEKATITSVHPPPRQMLPFSSTKNAAATRKGGWGNNRQIPAASPRIICQNISPNILH